MELAESHDVRVHQEPPVNVFKGERKRKRKRKRDCSQVFRVTGLPLRDTEEVKKELWTVIKENLADDEGQFKIDLVPSCDCEGWNALVEFDHGTPEFLEDIKNHPLRSVELEMGDIDVSIDAHFHGFTQLFTPRNPISMDIIAITGLAGHAYGSWRGRGTLRRMWLRDFLSKDLPNCRTMIYGYNSRLSTHGVGTILDYSRGFLEELKHVRTSEETQKRPIVFIAHSFGGIILAHSLVRSILTDRRDQPTIAALHKSTYGILFFSTPHKGLVINDLQQMLGAHHARRQLIEQIGKSSDLLQSQLANFKNIARDYKIVSFYEVEQIRELKQDSDTGDWKRTGPYVTKVDADSALLGFPESIEVQIPAGGDHSSMVKFDTRQQKDYKSTIDNLKTFELVANSVVAARHSDDTSSKNCPIFTVPFARDEHFISRHDEEGNDIIDIITQWFTLAKTHVRVSIVGLGGTGKSQIVIEYAYRYREQHASRWVFWVSCRNNAAFEQSYTSIVQQLKLPGYEDSKKRPLDLLSAWLEDINNGHWLMILDNADTLEMFRPTQISTNAAISAFTYGNYLPQVGHGDILVTSRNRSVVSELTNSEYVLHLGPMNENEAVELLYARLPERPKAVISRQLVAQLDRIPLAIGQAASYILTKRPRMSTERYLNLYQQEDARSKLLALENGDIRRDPGIPNAVINTWQLTFNQIQKSRPKSSELLSLMSTLDRQGIPGTLLETWLPDNLELEEAIGTLLEFSLVFSQNEGENFGMHRLVQLATQKWLRLNESHEVWQGEAIQLLSEALPYVTYENAAQCELLLSHVLKTLQYSLRDENLLLAQSSIREKLAEFYNIKGQYSVAIQMANQSLTLRQRFLTDSHEEVLSSKEALARAMFYQGGDSECIKLFSQILDARKSILGLKHASTLSIMSNLALAYSRQGQHEKAEELGIEALKLSTKVLGAEHTNTLFIMSKLGVAYSRQGQYEKAEELGVEVLKLQTRVLGAKHPVTLTSMSILAVNYFGQGQYEKAEELGVEVLKLQTQVLGAKHPVTLNSMSNLASNYSNQGQYEKAAELEAEVLKLSTKVLGAEYPETVISMNNLAHVSDLQGRVTEALHLLRDSAPALVKVLGPDHPVTKASLHSLGYLEDKHRSDTATII